MTQSIGQDVINHIEDEYDKPTTKPANLEGEDIDSILKTFNNHSYKYFSTKTLLLFKDAKATQLDNAIRNI